MSANTGDAVDEHMNELKALDEWTQVSETQRDSIEQVAKAHKIRLQKPPPKTKAKSTKKTTAKR